MKDKHNKSLTRKHYELLREIGIEIIMYDLKTYDGKDSMHQPAVVTHGFEIWGGLNEDVDFDELLDLLKMLKIAKDSDNLAINDAFDKLKMTIRIAE